MDDEQVETLFADCMDPEDDEGFIPYSRKYSFNGRYSSNVFCAYTICKRRLSIPHVTLCLRTNQKNPHHSALCTLYHQLDLKNTNKPKNMCMRVSMFACPFLQHYTRKKKKKPTNSRMSNVWSLHGDCVLFTRRLSPIHLKLNENRVRPAPDERSCRLRLNSK